MLAGLRSISHPCCLDWITVKDAPHDLHGSHLCIQSTDCHDQPKRGTLPD